MTLAFFFAMLLDGLSSASSLFLLAAGLTIIFGVTRIVNFAHGSFYMLGAYVAGSLLALLPGTGLGYWGAVAAAALAVGLLGVAVEMLLLRRLYRAPELYQLLATFGVVLVIADAALAVWGPEDLLAPRPPGLRGAVALLGRQMPAYDLFLIAVGPLALVLLRLLFRHTRWGATVRAATQDRDMVAALGVDEKRLFTMVFFLGALLAGLGGALQLPRAAANLQMDMGSIVEAFAIVVIGGMGSIGGAYAAAVLVAMIEAFGVALFPKLALLLVFAVMALVLALRPQGLFGRKVERPRGADAPPAGGGVLSWRWPAAGLALLVVVPAFLGAYPVAVLTEIVTLSLFAASLQFMMGPGGMISFGHAAFFGLGAYGAALATLHFGAPMPAGLAAAPLLAGFAGAAFGLVCVRLSGIYLAMLTLALAELVFTAATEWSDVTGGDNGILEVWPAAWAQAPYVFYLVALALAGGGIFLLRRVISAPLGYALRAGRDSPLRAEASGIDVLRVRWTAFTLAALCAGLAGGLFAYAKGSVFPSYLAVERSVGALVMVLLGGLHSIGGALLGAAVFTLLQEELVRLVDDWRAALGFVIIALVLVFPDGLAAALARRVRR